MSKFVLTAQLQLQAPNNVKQVVQQIQSQLSGVSVNIQVQNAGQAQKQIQQVAQQCNQATSAAERMGKAFALSIRRFAAFSIATRAVGLFTSTLGDAVQASIDFERQLIKVSQVTGKSIGQLRGLTKQITDLSTGFGVASSDLLNVSTILAQAGLSAEDTSAALRTLAKAALAPNFDSITETAEGAIAILAQFGQGVGALEKQLGSINAGAGAFAVEASDLIDVVRRTGGVFKSSGGNLNELLALFTSVRATTRESAESIGTGLRTIFTRIQRPKTIEYLKQFGVELTDLDGKFVGPYEAVKRLSEALAGLGDGDVTFIRIAEELGGFRQIGKVLPLLQQFSTAQSALNVAMKAGDSLTQDAASAQAALAVRIMKVKEEFLALIRSITETSTFQIMANTALSLASALIKIGDSIKPLLPMLAALATFRLAKGLGGFFGGMMSGAASGRTYNKGGKVLGFARGGLVPGTGNGDTVPAMLAPGEFVIRKSSVNKMGAGRLAAMNENRYAAGGITKAKQMGMSTADVLSSSRASIKSPRFSRESSVGIATTSYLPQPASSNISIDRDSDVINQVIGGVGYSLSSKFGPKNSLEAIQSLFKGKKNFAFGATIEGVGRDEESQFANIINQSISTAIDTSANRFATEVMKTSPPGSVKKLSSFYNTLDQGFRGQLFENTISALAGKPLSGQDSRRPFDFTRGIGKFRSIYGNLGMDYIDAKITKSSAGLGTTGLLTSPGEDALKSKVSGQLALESLPFIQSIIGSAKKRYFGGLIQKFAEGGEVLERGTQKYLISDVVKGMRELQGNPTLSQKDAIDLFNSKDARGDFIYTNFGGKGSIKLPKWMGTYKPQSAAYGRWQQNQASNQDRIASSLAVKGKTMRDYEARREFATGGGVGTDTVPALLTPGEFVVNRKSAQRIGYGNLNRMNKVGKYASGGVVQRFKSGSSGTGVKGDIPVQKIVMEGLNKSNASALKVATVLDKLTLGGLGKLAIATNSLVMSFVKGESFSQKYQKQLTYLNSVLPTFSDVLASNAKYNKRSSTLQMELTHAIATNIKALQDSGASQAEVRKHAIQYANALAQNSKQMGAPVPTPSGPKPPSGSPPTPSGPFPPNNPPKNGWSTVGGSMGAKAGGSSSSGGGASPTKPSGGMGNMLGDNKMMAASMATSLIQGFLPAVDESSSAMLKMTHGMLGLITTVASVGFALEAFGLQINKQSMGGIMDFLGGGKGAKTGLKNVGSLWQTGQGASTAARTAGLQAGRGALRAGSALQSVGMPTFGKGLTSLAGPLSKVVTGFANLGGPLIAITGSATLVTQAFNTAISSIYDYDSQLKKAIESGNVDKAEKIAGKKAGLEGANTARAVGATGGAAIGFVLGGPIGAAIGAAIGAGVSTLITGAISNIFGEAGDKWIAGIGTLFGGATYDSAIALAAAQAGAVKTQKALDEAQKTATSAMDDFKRGSISASDALAKIRSKSSEVSQQQKRTANFVSENSKNRSTGASSYGRETMAYLSLGYVDSTKERNDNLSKQNVEQINQTSKSLSDSFNVESEARQATIRSGVARGKNSEEIRTTAMGDLRSQREQALKTAAVAAKSGDDDTYNAAIAQAEQLRQSMEQVDKEIANIEKEVKRQKELYNAMNLGLRSGVATATALSANMDKFSSGLEVGGSSFVNDVEFLQQAMSSSAQAMDPAEIQNAVKGVSDNLRQFGSSEQYIKKFEGNVAAFTQAQAGYNTAFNNIKKSMSDADFKNLSPDDLKKKFAEELTKGMGPDVSEDAKKNLKSVIEGMELDTGEVDKILAGDLSVFGDKLSESQKKMLEDVQKIAAERAKAEQVLIDFTKKRIDAERNLVQAQQEALDLTMEGREIQGKYGGKAVTGQERRNNLLAKSNAESGRLGLTNMRTGSIGELRQRNAEIKGSFAAIEAKRSQQGGMSGKSGVEADETQKDLQKAYKTQIDTIRGLIKLEEEQLKITQEKNKLEKDSMESLIKGDVEDFFKKQSAVGATAAIASGDSRLQNFYGADALGMAYQDIQRQQDAGVQSLYGQQLAGAGGLTESAAGAALSSRGVTDMRAAQVMAGTTAEEEASKSRLRELGGMLGETGQLGTEIAEMQVSTALVNLTAAQVTFDKTMERGNEKAKEAQAIENQRAMSRGGVVYASRGIFVPRGTDTVPAMLTPGEFVVNRGAVQRGNNLQLLHAMNNNNSVGAVSSDGSAVGMARGGRVQYFSEGGQAGGGGFFSGMFDGLSKFATTFGAEISSAVEKLKGINISIKLDSTNVNVNLNDGGLLKALTGEVQTKIFESIESQFRVVEGGKLKRDSKVLGNR
jgi:TP901 family phage tail tape measure protein